MYLGRKDGTFHFRISNHTNALSATLWLPATMICRITWYSIAKADNSLVRLAPPCSITRANFAHIPGERPKGYFWAFCLLMRHCLNIRTQLQTTTGSRTDRQHSHLCSFFSRSIALFVLIYSVPMLFHRVHEDGQAFYCDHCDFVTSQIDAFQDHLSCHSKRTTGFSCIACRQRFPDLEPLRLHMKVFS